MSTPLTDEELLAYSSKPIITPIRGKPVLINQSLQNTRIPFFQKPLFGPLLFVNAASDARDHCAAERTFLSWLRLSTYLAIVSVAIVISFHLKAQPSDLERRSALPLGIVFWVLSMTCLASGASNYVRTVVRYSRRQALVQSGWKTQVIFTVVACAILATCVLFISIDSKSF